MTTRRDFIVRCNECYEESVWSADVLRHTKSSTLIENAGYATESGESFLDGTKHYCPDCNDREKDTFHVYGGRGEEYLGPVQAWGIVDARRVAWDEFDQENIVKREKVEVPL